jgi:hypothetical protein
MSGRRSSLAELERLLRVIEPGAHDLGRYLAEHAERLAPRLKVEVEELRAIAVLPDQEAAPRVKELLMRRDHARAQHHEAALQEAVAGAAQRLASTAVWKGPAAVLDVRLLLGELLADPSRKYIGFEGGPFDVHLLRSKLVEVARVLPLQYSDLIGWVDPSGLHFRWHGGRGGLNLFPQVVSPVDAAYVLTVNIPPPVREEPRTAPPRRSRLALAKAPPSSESRKGGWIADVLAQISLTP